MQSPVAFLTILFNTVLAKQHLANASLYTVDYCSQCLICSLPIIYNIQGVQQRSVL